MSFPVTPGMQRDIEAMARAEEAFAISDGPSVLERWRRLGAAVDADSPHAPFSVTAASPGVWETAAWELALRIERLEQARAALAREGGGS